MQVQVSRLDYKPPAFSLDPLASRHALHLYSLQKYKEIILDPSISPIRPPSDSGNTTFDILKNALEGYRDLLLRSELRTWRDEWRELVDGEMGGWVNDNDDDDDTGHWTPGRVNAVSSPGVGSKRAKERAVEAE